MKFNVNDYVRVKLTEAGRLHILQEHKALYDRLQLPAGDYSPLPKEDEEGWSTFQLWVLMSRFGSMIEVGVWGDNLPFETEIEIVEVKRIADQHCCAFPPDGKHCAGNSEAKEG